MTLKELTQCIPPQYTEFIGKQIIEYIDTTPTYLNINPSNSIEEKVYYKESF